MCAIVGVINSKEAAQVSYYALFSMQHRGQQATGISSCYEDKIKTIKNRGLVTEVFNKDSFDILKGDIAVGHNRYGTAGNDSMLDAQPIVAKYSLGEISVVHNGNFINKNEIRSRLIEEGAIFQSSMDTENMTHLIARSQKPHLQERIVEAINTIKGAYCLLILSRHKIFAIRDKYGIRPLSIGRLKDGGYIVASETCAFDLVEAEFVRDVKPGEMVIFEKGKNEIISVQLYEPKSRICAFEYIYFARPDSVIEGKNVYQARKRMGEALAKEASVEADLVVPVPDSGVAAALGYARQSGLPFEMAIVRNHYVGRTFIEPTQALRDLKVKLKLSPISSELKGKRVVVIDDSIVRGTTSKQIVALLKHAGAKEIHMRIAAPSIKHPCRYGIDTPSYEELISANNSDEQVRKHIKADSLKFLSIESLIKSIGDEREYSLASFDGNYFIE